MISDWQSKNGRLPIFLLAGSTIEPTIVPIPPQAHSLVLFYGEFSPKSSGR